MVRFERVRVRAAERVAEFLGRVGEVLAQRLRGEIQTAHEPDEAFGCVVLFGRELGRHEGLQGAGWAGRGEVEVVEFLG